MYDAAEIAAILKKNERNLRPIPAGIESRGTLSAKPKALLFDIYGTLFISASGDIGTAENAPFGRETLAAALREFGIAEDPETLKARFFREVRTEHDRLRSLDPPVEYPEVRTEELWRRLLGVDAETAGRFAAAYEAAVNPVSPMPAAEELLGAVAASPSPPVLGLVSNAQFFTPLLFDAFFGKPLRELGFDRELCVFSFLFREAKPSVRLFLRAGEVLAGRGIRTDETVFVGNDMLNDLYPARAAGFRTCLFAGDLRSLRLRNDDPRCGFDPDLVITGLMELAPYV